MKLYKKHPQNWGWNRSVVPATLDDLKAALAEHGMVAVPVEPTEVILDNIHCSIVCPASGTNDPEKIYKAMIKAAEGRQ